MIKQFFILIFLFGFTVIQAQENDEKLYWSTTKLTWQDFKAQPDPSDPYHANTYSGFTFSWSINQDENGRNFSFDVKSYFLPNQSWVKKGKANPYLLAHEQLHFDISELQARKFEKALSSFDTSGSISQIKQRMKKIYQRIEHEREAIQNKYDKETQHGNNKESQKKWSLLIQQKLSD
ncbi:DUF922 domain-containing protein [Mesonia aquimarina]|uniref:DUF922 domain-containing protein n=1 Tax=Mesonia aquimarina TaxID=1504967 RepID=UPI000EF5865D|nr:DUF922 domain-containing protein [Mesonia aquimarina]